MFLSDGDINEYIARGLLGISPFVNQIRPMVTCAGGARFGPSRGLSSAGYDLCLAEEYNIFTPATGVLSCVDPADFDLDVLRKFRGESCVIPPGGFALGRSLEYVRMPRDLIGICLGKSTYARCGVIVNVTPIEPEWEGHITIEISNTSQLPVRVHSHAGIAQLLFAKISGTVGVSYKDRGGKYQGQTGVTPPK